MYIGDAIAMGVCTDIVPFYEEANENYEHVDWSILNKLYPEIRFQRIVFQAEVDLTTIFEKINEKFDAVEASIMGWEYWGTNDPEYYGYLSRKRDICPKPPGPETLKTVVREDGNEYYTVATLWELKHELDEHEARYGKSNWFFSVYIPENEAKSHWNESKWEYDEIGRETTVTEDLYYVQDINRYIKITEGIKEY